MLTGELVTEHLIEDVAQAAGWAEASPIESVFGPAPFADRERRCSGTGRADLLCEPWVDHETPGLAAARTYVLRSERPAVAGTADRPLVQVRAHPSDIAAVGTSLRRQGSARRAEHPAPSLTATRPELATVVTDDRRSGPTDRAELGVVTDSEAGNRSHPATAAAGANGTPVAVGAAWPTRCVTPGGQVSTAATGLDRDHLANRTDRLAPIDGRLSVLLAMRARHPGLLRTRHADGPAGLPRFDALRHAADRATNDGAGVAAAADGFPVPAGDDLALRPTKVARFPRGWVGRRTALTQSRPGFETTSDWHRPFAAITLLRPRPLPALRA